MFLNKKLLFFSLIFENTYIFDQIQTKTSPSLQVYLNINWQHYDSKIEAYKNIGKYKINWTQICFFIDKS